MLDSALSIKINKFQRHPCSFLQGWMSEVLITWDLTSSGSKAQNKPIKKNMYAAAGTKQRIPRHPIMREGQTDMLLVLMEWKQFESSGLLGNFS